MVPLYYGFMKNNAINEHFLRKLSGKTICKSIIKIETIKIIKLVLALSNKTGIIDHTLD